MAWAKAGPMPDLRWSVLGTGLNAWLVPCVWPLLFDAPGSAAATGAGALALGVLASGVTCLREHTRAAGRLLLLGFPVTLGVAVAALPPETRREALGTVPLLAAVIGLWVHALASLAALRAGQPAVDVEHEALRAVPAPAPRSSRLRGGVTTLLVGGGLAVGVVAPTLGDARMLDARWGDAADAGALLTAVVAAALGAACTGPFLASLLAANGPPPAPRTDRTLRIGSLLLLSMLGAATYAIIR